MKQSFILLLSGMIITLISLMFFGTDALLNLLDFYQSTDSPAAQDMAVGVSHSIRSVFTGMVIGILGIILLLAGLITMFFEKMKVVGAQNSKRKNSINN